MRTKWYSCPNGCLLPPRKKSLKEFDDGTYGFAYYDFNFCPCCGSLMPYSQEKLRGFFDIFNTHPALKDAQKLLYKSEYETAAREAFVTVETALKKSLDLIHTALIWQQRHSHLKWTRKREKWSSLR